MCKIAKVAIDASRFSQKRRWSFDLRRRSLRPRGEQSTADSCRGRSLTRGWARRRREHGAESKLRNSRCKAEMNTRKKSATLTTELSMTTTRSGELNHGPSTRTRGLRGFMPETRRLESFTAGYGRGLEQPAGYDADRRRGLSMTADSWQRAPGRTAARRPVSSPRFSQAEGDKPRFDLIPV